MAEQAKKPAKYQRRRPELTPCFKIVNEHLDSFVQARESENRPLPQYVIDEFEAFIKCGIPTYGFLRLKCSCCAEEKIVAFSCKKRGFCPSCCAKRQAETAVHLVDNVLPLAPYRQMVLSFPIPLRYWLHTNKKLFSKIHSIVIKEMHRYYINKAKLDGIKSPYPGSISFTQRAGSALNVNPHLHVLLLDGVYTEVNGVVKLRNIDAITDDEVAWLCENIAKNVMRHLTKEGYLDKDGEVVQNPMMDDLFQENEAITAAAYASIAGKIAFGKNAGKYVTRIGSGFGYFEEVPLAKGKRCYSVNGFSLHCNTSTNTHARDRLEKLIEYIARGPLSNERVKITDDGKVKLRLKTAWRDGTSHLLLSPHEFLEKLAAIIPPPKSHLVRWGGVFAANSPFREKIILKPEEKKGFDFQNREKKRVNKSWSLVLARVFKLDVLKCDCGGDLTPLGAVQDPVEVKRYLKHLKIDYDPPPRGPPRQMQGSFGFGQQYVSDGTEPDFYPD
jgi:hypothetical protein